MLKAVIRVTTSAIKRCRFCENSHGELALRKAFQNISKCSD